MIIEHKKIELNNRIVFEAIISDTPHKFSYPLQNEACFIYVKQGKNTVFTPDEIVEIPEGNLAFANSGNIIFKSTPNENSGLYHATIVHIDKQFVLNLFSNGFPKINLSEKPKPSRDVLTGKACVIMNNYIKGISYYFDNRHIASEEIIMLKVKEVLLLLLQSKKTRQVSSLLENFVNRHTADFRETVETHLFHEISLTEMAHLCNMSLSTFKRHFKKIYGTTPNSYIFDRRLEKSKQLLATSELSLTDVAFSSGFKTVSHYSRKFKEKFGIPPSQYKLTFPDKFLHLSENAI